ncbi:MAG: hypothetical protein JNL54_21930 [Kineosporiaceae bacterium]|nr:hypothetical protein [Kineosporiaceae bacterium]
MKLSAYFDTLLKDTVNLPLSRLDQLNDRVESIYRAVRADDKYGGLLTDKSKQGSWAHRTIIKPKPDKEYDADVLLHLDHNPDWDSDKAEYIEQLYWALNRVGYPDRHRKTRCVRVQYANDCHIDLVPYVNAPGGRRIVNKTSGEWELTNPHGFSDWMKGCDDLTNAYFRKVVRLMKFLRDHKNSFTGTPSIILTTLLGNRASWATKIMRPTAYSTVPDTLVTLVEDLDQWMQELTGMPSVEDPSSPGTTFDHRWSEASYNYFRDRIHVHAQEMRDALDEQDRDASVEKWRSLFGDGFRRDSQENKSASPFTAPAYAGGGASSSRAGRAG